MSVESTSQRSGLRKCRLDLRTSTSEGRSVIGRIPNKECAKAIVLNTVLNVFSRRFGRRRQCRRLSRRHLPLQSTRAISSATRRRLFALSQRGNDENAFDSQTGLLRRRPRSTPHDRKDAHDSEYASRDDRRRGTALLGRHKATRSNVAQMFGHTRNLSTTSERRSRIQNGVRFQGRLSRGSVVGDYRGIGHSRHKSRNHGRKFRETSRGKKWDGSRGGSRRGLLSRWIVERRFELRRECGGFVLRGWDRVGHFGRVRSAVEESGGVGRFRGEIVDEFERRGK